VEKHPCLCCETGFAFWVAALCRLSRVAGWKSGRRVRVAAMGECSMWNSRRACETARWSVQTFVLAAVQQQCTAASGKVLLGI
jgi:hypothetical protein